MRDGLKNTRSSFSPFSVTVVFLALIVIGAAFIPVLDIRYQPSRNLPEINIRYYWNNASPKVIEDETSKLEGILGKISQVKSIESNSSIGYGTITLTFDKTADLDKKRYEISTLIRQVRGKLPEGMSYPEIVSRSVTEENQTAFMTLTLNANASTHFIKKIGEQELIPALSGIAGVGDIILSGATPYRWEVTFDPELLHTYDVPVYEIRSALNRLGENVFLGNHTDPNGSAIPVLYTAGTIDPNHWGTVPIGNKNGRVIYLSDVATVKLNEQPPANYHRINGQNTVNLTIYSDPGVNQVRLAAQIREQLNSIRQTLPNGYWVGVSNDSTEFIKEDLKRIGTRTFFSLLILLFFVLLVSRSFRILLILTISLIANLLIAIAFYYLFRIEIHLYSLAGITVSFGIIIDNSIIMVSHLQKQKGLRVFISLLAATLTTLGALSVVFFLKDNQKALLLDFTYVMLINLSVSLLVSLFFVPALMEQIYHKKAKTSSFRMRRRIVNLTGFYEGFIRFGKRFRWAFFVLAIVGFGLPVNSLPDSLDRETAWARFYNKTLGSKVVNHTIKPVASKILGGALRLFTEYVFESNFYSNPERTTLHVSGKMPEGCTVHQLNEAIRKMEQYISQFPEVAQFETHIYSYNNSSIIIRFTEEAEKSSFPYLLKSRIEQKVISLGGMDWGVYGVGRGFSNALSTGYKNQRILLTGYNYDQLYDYAELLIDNLLENERVEEPEITSSQGYGYASDSRYEYLLKVDKNELAVYGLNYYNYSQSLFTQLYNGHLNPVYKNAEMQPVVLTSIKSDRYNKWNFYHTPVHTLNGQKKLSLAGKIDKALTGKSIYKKDQVYQMSVNYNFLGPSPLAKIVRERAIEDINKVLPLGYKASERTYYYWNPRDKKQYFLLVLIIVIIYFVTSILFESLLKPLAVISLIPISFIGVFLTFYLFGFNFDQGGFASFILLSGLVVNAAIYIINDFNNLVARRNQPISLKTYLKAFNQKIIAILLTILSTVLGLVPFVWGGQNEVFWFAFAAGAMGGLIFSWVAILIYLPLLLRLKPHR
jgi:multidrug efflux pump subunit AcrB